MKRFLGLALLLALMAVCMAVPASATRSLQKGDSTPTLDRLDKLDRDPAAAIERNCAKLGHNPAQIGFDEATCTEPGYYVLECTRCHKEWKEKAKDKLGHNYQYAQTNPALCESDGKEWFECTRCTDTQYQTIPKLGHDYRVTSTVDATCGKDGKKIYTCSRLGCGAQKSETISATGNHKWDHTHTNRDDVECVAGGTAYYICSVCGDQKNESVPATGHDWKQVGQLTPTCGKDGAYYLQCSKCGEEKSEARPAAGAHSWEYSHTNRDDVECVAGGTAYYICSVCGDQKNESVPAKGHQWKAVSALSATCDSPKTVTYQCSTCNEKKTEKEGSAAEHIWQLAYSEPATCAADGYKLYKCATCSKDKMETIPATGNCTYGEWIVAVNASCDKDGLKVAACTQCGDKKEQKIPATGHKWKDGQVTKQPTCTEDGQASSVCERCGATDSSRTIEKLGHSYGAESVTKAATCTAAGEKQATCKTCGHVKKTAVKATGHSFGAESVVKAATCTADGEKQVTCKTCGAVEKTAIKATGHSYGEWKVTKEATETDTGLKERVCKNCSDKETETIPKKVKPTATPKPTKTPKPTATPKVTATPKPTATPKATATPKKSANKASSASLKAVDGVIEIYSTAGKVNLRTGPSKKDGTAGQIAKKNTDVGALIDAQVDSTGTVWFKVRHKNKNVWITSDYACAVIGDVTDSPDRHVGVDSEDLTDICFSYISEAADHYGLELEMSGEASDDAVTIGGASDFVEYIELTGEGYSLYGIEVGDKLKTVENAMKKNGLYCASKSGGTYVYKRPCQLFSMCVTEDGFDSYIEVVLDGNKCVESISWNAYTE